MELLEHLGFAQDARVVVLHVDDVGLCSAANRGWLRAREGSATCASVMVPCPGFDEIARWARSEPSADLGVHLTLNCEYARERWGPLCDDVPSLQAPDGGLWDTSKQTVLHAAEDEVERELRAQIERALDAGIDVTHIDGHMGTVFDLRFVHVYLRLANDFRIPMFLPQVDRALLLALGMPDELDRYLAHLDAAAQAGFPIFDHFDLDSLGFEAGTGSEHNCRRIERLQPGLTYLITHCSEPTDAFGGLSSGAQRIEECRVYSDGTIDAVLAREGVHAIGMRPLRDWLRRPPGPAALPEPGRV